jgi:uncharacterized protein YmfQ (DUF2313 family)
MSPRAHSARVCFWCLKFLTVPLRAPNIGWWTLVHLRKDRIEAAQAVESRQQRNLDHWQFGIIQKPLRPLHECRLGNLTGAGAEMFVE